MAKSDRQGSSSRSSSPKRFAVTVSGRVQGVGFRYFTRQCASSHGLSGWVRNASNGTVQLEVQGESAVVDLFLREVQQGPSLSYVSDMKIREIPVVDSERGGEFSIHH